MLYFAYGSNMLTARLRQRTPSAQVLTSARLEGYVLKCNKQGRDGSGKGNIEATGLYSDRVYGVVYQLDPADKSRLDQAESLGVGYAQKMVRLTTPQGEIEALTYAALRIDDTLRPFHWYKALLVQGAQENELPRHYLLNLESIQAIEDPNQVRRQKNLMVIHQTTATNLSRGAIRC